MAVVQPNAPQTFQIESASKVILDRSHRIHLSKLSESNFQLLRKPFKNSLESIVLLLHLTRRYRLEGSVSTRCKPFCVSVHCSLRCSAYLLESVQTSFASPGRSPPVARSDLAQQQQQLTSWSKYSFVLRQLSQLVSSSAAIADAAVMNASSCPTQHIA